MEINGIYIDVSSKSQKNWIKKYRKLEEYYKKYGNIDVSQGYEIDGIKLGTWLREQRKAYYGKGECKITREKIALLDFLGIKWDIREEKWDANYYLIEGYYKEYGHINVPQSYEVDGEKLGRWLNTQRMAYRGKGKVKISAD